MLLRCFAALALCCATAVPASAGDIEILDPYARASSPSAKTGAAFMGLENRSDADDRLIAARSDAARRVELHTHVETGDGILQMTQIEDGVLLPAGGSHHMKRGGDHVMLMGLTGPLEQGAEIVITLVFENAGEVEVTVPVDNERSPDRSH